MSIRTLTQLIDAVNKNLAWRKREITTIKFMIEDARAHEKRFLIRAGIALLYAHWEGFVKYAASAYLEYVAFQKLPYEKLQHSFIALAFKGQLNEATETNRASVFTRAVTLLIADRAKCSDIPWENVIRTSNLNFNVLTDIMCMVNLDITPYSLRQNLIDEKLLARRNRIAHGEEQVADNADYDEVHTEVLEMLDHISDQIGIAATQKAYQVVP